MSVSSGFFNSLNGDRKYNAAQMSAIFDGLIIDGVLWNFLPGIRADGPPFWIHFCVDGGRYEI